MFFFIIIYNNIIILENNTGCFVLQYFRLLIFQINNISVLPMHSQMSANLITQTPHVCFSNQFNNKRLIDRV